jgi:enoyl-CoA hydratase/carnithine racemase
VGAVAVVTIDRPPLNVLSNRVRAELDAQLEQIASDDGVRVVVLHGAGGRAFSVGSDVREFDQTAQPGGGRERALREHQQCNRVATFPKPVIAAIEGFCLGGGFELALACDLRVASASSRFGLPEVRLGVFPSGGGTERLPDLVGRARAKELMFLGDQLDAAEAERLGIVNRRVPDRQALAAATELATRIAEQPAASVRTIKQLVDAPFQGEMEARIEAVAAATEAIFQTRDAREGREAFLAKRPPRFEHR